MKKLLVIALALFTLNGLAQERRKGPKDKTERADRMKDMTPQEVADLKSKHLTLSLDLTDTQQKKVRQLIFEQATERQKLRDERLAKKTEDTKPSKEEMVKMKSEHLDQQIAMKREMKAILSTEQYAKFEQMSHKKRSRKGRRKQQGKRRN